MSLRSWGVSSLVGILAASCSVDERRFDAVAGSNLPGAAGAGPDVVASSEPGSSEAPGNDGAGPGLAGSGPGSDGPGAIGGDVPLDLATDAGGVSAVSPVDCSAADAGCVCLPDAEGTCYVPVTPDCPGCAIGGECLAAGTVNPDQGCLVCDPIQNTLDWSSNEGAACDDGLFCTTNDACSASACQGTPLDCDDGVECTGPSQCDEEQGRCTPPENLCGANGFCNTETGSCASTCTGCLINGTCVAAGAAQPGNACFVCDPSLSGESYVAAVGRVCGAAPTACSGQDTCDAGGLCQPNNAAAGTPCGDPAVSACNGRDTCDAVGNCLNNITPNGSACDDGEFCSLGDSCQAGVCVSGGPRDCGSGLVCFDDACQCQGCTIGGVCVASGTRNPANVCQICDVARSTTAFSGASTGACDDGEFCTINDSCQAGVCAGGGARVCAAGEQCTGNQCVAVANPFECTDPSPPSLAPETNIVFAGPPPNSPRGGTIVPGTYVMRSVEWWDGTILPAAVPGMGIEFRDGGFYHQNRTTFDRDSRAALTGFRQVGTFTATGTTLTTEGTNCGIAGSGRTVYGYTADDTFLTLFQDEPDGVVRIENYNRQ